MSIIGLSGSDLLTGLQICHWIYSHCFEKINAADARYLQFGQYIKGLGDVLQDLRQHVEAQRAPDLLNLDGFVTEAGPPASFRDFIEAAGNYETTLRECEHFLRKHRDLSWNKAGFVVNVKWGLSLQQRVDELQSRLRAHCGKVLLILEPLRFHQLDRIENMVARTYDHVNPPPTVPASLIPAHVTQRFQLQLQQELLQRNVTLDSLSRHEGLDSVYRHWRDSNPNQPEVFEAYLSLLKCAWLVTQLELAAPFQSARDGLPYRTAIQQIKRHIAPRLLQSTGLERYESDLQRLNAASFSLLNVNQSATGGSQPDDEYLLEEKLAEIKLLGDARTQQTLKIYRISQTKIRLVREKVTESVAANSFETTRTVVQESDSINIESDHLMPFYAAPYTTSSIGLEVRSGNETGRRAYFFNSLQDAFRVQRAVTSHSVMSDIDNVSWILREPGFRNRGKSGKCRIQLWCTSNESSSCARVDADRMTGWQPMSAMNSLRRTNTGGDSRSVGASLNSGASSTTTSTLTSIMSKLDSGALDSSFASIYSEGDGRSANIVTAGSPYLPALIVYSMVAGAYGMLHVEMSPDLQIDQTACHCARDPERCKTAILKSTRSNKPFTVRKYPPGDADGRSTIDDWDLCIFGRPSAYGMGRHPLFERTKALKPTWLGLDFDTVEARRKFVRHYNTVASLRDEERDKIENLRKQLLYLSHRPREATKGSGAGGDPCLSRGSTFGTNESQTTIRQVRQQDGDTPSASAPLRLLPDLPPTLFQRMSFGSNDV